MRILKSIITQLVNHAKKDAPIEACGYLASKDSIITASYELTNIDASTEHFRFDPKEQFMTLKDARLKGLEICAAYHSHPLSPARPSFEDIKLAYDPDILYVIVSLCNAVEDIKAFKIKDKNIESIKLEVVEDEGI